MSTVVHKKERLLFEEKMRDVRTRYADLLEKLKHIPHLPVPRSFDHQLALQEVQGINSWQGNRLDLKSLDPIYLEYHKKHYRGRGLRGISQDSYEFVDREENIWDHPKAEFDSTGDLILNMTDIADQVPYLSSWIQPPDFPPTITRLIQFHPGHGLPWHSHHQGPFFHSYYTYGFMITVIRTNPQVINSVRVDSREETSVSLHYEAGSTYLLNGWHSHQVVNKGVEIRFNLQHILNLNEEKTLLFLQPYVEQYRGPYLPEIFQ